MVEPLRLEASVVDKFSRPLRDLRDALNAVGAPRNLRQIEREFGRLQRAIAQASQDVRAGLSAALSGLGVAGFSASAGIAAVTQSVRTLASGVGELRALSRETGFSVQSMRVLEAAASRFQVAPDSVRAGLKTFASNLADFRRQWGETYSTVLARAPDLAQALRTASPDKAVDVALDFLSRIEDRQTAGRYAKLLFGTDEFARFGQHGAAELRAILADTFKRIGELTPDEAAKTEAFGQASHKIKASLEGLGKTIAVELAPQLSTFANSADRVIQANRGQIGEAVARALQQIGRGAKAFNDAIEGSIGWDGLIKGLVAIKIVETAGGLLRLGGGFLELGKAARGADLATLAKVFAVLAPLGALWAANRKGSGGAGAPNGGQAGTSGGDAGAASSTPPASPSADANDTGRKVDERIGRAMRESVAAGIEKGLTTGAPGGPGGAGAAPLFGYGSGAAAALATLRRAMGGGGGGPSGPFVGNPGVGGYWTAERRAYAIDRLMKEAGLSAWGAAGLVARWAGIEAKGGPTSVNPRSGATNIGQWLGARKIGLKGPTLDAGLDHAIAELTPGTPQSARAGVAGAAMVLRNARNAEEGSRGASMFERAEGYNSATGYDNFTRATPTERVYRDRFSSPAKSDAPAPGAAFDAARKAGAARAGASPVPLFLRIHGAGSNMRVKADEGSAFSEIKVERGRAAQDQ